MPLYRRRVEVTKTWGKRTDNFSEMTGRNFTRLEVKVVKLSLRDKSVLEFRKVAPFLNKGRRQTGRCRKKG